MILRRDLYPAMERAGIPRVGPTGEKRTFHSLRHTFARVAIEHNRPILALQASRALVARRDEQRVRPLREGNPEEGGRGDVEVFGVYGITPGTDGTRPDLRPARARKNGASLRLLLAAGGLKWGWFGFLRSLERLLR